MGLGGKYLRLCRKELLLILLIENIPDSRLNHHVFVLIITKRGILHDDASFQIEKNDRCEALGRRIFFIFTSYDFRKHQAKILGQKR